MTKMAVIVLPLAFLSLIFGQGSTSHHHGGIVRIYARSLGTASVDEGRPGRSAGDMNFQGFALEDRPGHTIGHASVICTSMGRTLPGTAFSCSAVYVLPRGRIIAAGARQRRDYYVFAVTGGTGVYEGDGGTLVGSLIKLRPRRDKLFISLV